MKYQYNGGRDEIDLATASYNELALAYRRVFAFRRTIQRKIDKNRDMIRLGKKCVPTEDSVRWWRSTRMQDKQLQKLDRMLARIAYDKSFKEDRVDAMPPLDSL